MSLNTRPTFQENITNILKGKINNVKKEVPDFTEEIRQKVKIDWKIIDTSTKNYGKKLKDYNISAIVNSFKPVGSKYCILDKPANINIEKKLDMGLQFLEFYTLLEEMKYPNNRNTKKQLEPSEVEILREKSQKIVDYILHGDKVDKKFTPWLKTYKSNKDKKDLFMGIISVDIPHPVNNNIIKYECSETQHYVAFCYHKSLHRLYIFDSASHNPIEDESEIFYILKFTFEKLLEETNKIAMPVRQTRNRKITTEITKNTQPALEIYGMKFQYVLQPGAGDREEEDVRSYNNQNVFCHTWSMWFCYMFITFYDAKNPQNFIDFIESKCHSEEMLNLAMIKSFARWIAMEIFEKDDLNENSVESEKEEAVFARKGAETALKAKDMTRIQEIIHTYMIKAKPYLGLNFIYNWKDDSQGRPESITSIEILSKLRKIKLDINLVQDIAPNQKDKIAKYQQLFQQKNQNQAGPSNLSTFKTIQQLEENNTQVDAILNNLVRQVQAESQAKPQPQAQFKSQNPKLVV